LKQSTTKKERLKIATTFGFDWNRTSKAIEFNNEELKGCTNIGIVASSLEESQRLMNSSW
jgi:hypothetical protein